MTPQLCWTCRNAVPSRRTGRGCKWSRGLKPVLGWVAEPVHKAVIGETWLVRACPKYRPDARK